jgi:hypothetical protein
MVEVMPAWTFVRERRYLALRAGVAAAAASVGPSFARGLLPRSTTDQAMVTGATAAYALGFASLGLSIAEAVSEIIVTNRQGGNPDNIALASRTTTASPCRWQLPSPWRAWYRSAQWPGPSLWARIGSSTMWCLGADCP